MIKKKKYYFKIRTNKNDIVNLVSKGIDTKDAEVKLLRSLKGQKFEVISVSDKAPTEKEKVKVKESFEETIMGIKSGSYSKDKTRRNKTFFN